MRRCCWLERPGPASPALFATPPPRREALTRPLSLSLPPSSPNDDDDHHHQVLRWSDGHEEQIEGTYVTEGVLPKGSMWAMNPLPESPTADFPPPCKAGTHPPVRAPMAVGQYGTNPGPCAGNWPTTVNIMDTVRVPADLAPGEYVLGWRWDCELTAQVWSACADITIAPADPVVEA